MNTRTAVATLALAALNLTAIALQDEDAAAVPFEAGTLLVAAAGEGAIGAFDPDGPGGGADNGEDDGALPQPVTGLSTPEDLLFAPDGLLYFSDRDSNLVLVADATGAVQQSIGGTSGLLAPTGLAFGPDGALYVSSSGSDRVLVFDRDGDLVQTVGAFDGLDEPWGLAFGPDGRLYAASTGSDRVLVFDPAGPLVGELDAGGALSAPLGLCFDGTGRLWVASSGNDRVLALDADGDVVADWDGGGELLAPCGLAFGPDGLLYVSSPVSDRVLALDADGDIVRTLDAADGASGPRGLAFVPQLFKATLKGTLRRPGLPPQKFSAKAVVAATPGRPELGVRLLDPAGPLAAAWDSDTWWLRGAVVSAGPLAKARGFVGEQVGGGAAHAGLTTLQLQWKGKLDPADDDDPDDDTVLPPAFRLKSGSGRFQRGGPEGIAIGKLRTGGAIKP